jgi:hypothetical protein
LDECEYGIIKCVKESGYGVSLTMRKTINNPSGLPTSGPRINPGTSITRHRLASLSKSTLENF